MTSGENSHLAGHVSARRHLLHLLCLADFSFVLVVGQDQEVWKEVSWRIHVNRQERTKTRPKVGEAERRFQTLAPRLWNPSASQSLSSLASSPARWVFSPGLRPHSSPYQHVASKEARDMLGDEWREDPGTLCPNVGSPIIRKQETGEPTCWTGVPDASIEASRPVIGLTFPPTIGT